MKNYDDLTNRLLERRNRYVAEQKKKKQVIARTTVSVGSVALVSLAGFALFKNDAFHDAPLISVSDTTTTVANTPTKIGDTTTAGDVTAPTTDGGIVTPTNPTTSVPVPSQTTTGQTQPTATTPSKTEPTKTNPTQPTASQTRPTATQTQPTQTTPTTQPTVPSQENNYIVAETPLSTEGDPGSPYAISAKIPAQCNIAEETVTISLSYGPFRGLMLKPDASGYILVKIEADDGKEIILKKIDIREFVSSEYFVDEVWGEDGWPIAYNYSHTETVQLPISLCSKEKGRIWITVEDESDILGTGVPFEYTRTEASICFVSLY